MQLIGVQPLDDKEDASPDRSVFFRVNGRYHQATVQDAAAANGKQRRQADPSVSSQMGSPFSGVVSALLKELGDQVTQGEVVLSISAIKMIINVSASSDGYLKGLNIKAGENVDKGDLLFEISISP